MTWESTNVWVSLLGPTLWQLLYEVCQHVLTEIQWNCDLPSFLSSCVVELRAPRSFCVFLRAMVLFFLYPLPFVCSKVKWSIASRPVALYVADRGIVLGPLPLWCGLKHRLGIWWEKLLLRTHRCLCFNKLSSVGITGAGMDSPLTRNVD